MNQKQLIQLLHEKHGKLYLTKEEAAKELGVGVATIDRMRQTGDLKSSKIKGSIKFSLSEIAKFTKN
jgi:excisionase family DNA binding protein